MENYRQCTKMPQGKYLVYKETENGGYYLRSDSDTQWVADPMAFDAFHGYRSPRESCQDEYKHSTPISEEEVLRIIGKAA